MTTIFFVFYFFVRPTCFSDFFFKNKFDIFSDKIYIYFFYFKNIFIRNFDVKLFWAFLHLENHYPTILGAHANPNSIGIKDPILHRLIFWSLANENTSYFGKVHDQVYWTEISKKAYQLVYEVHYGSELYSLYSLRGPLNNICVLKYEQNNIIYLKCN